MLLLDAQNKSVSLTNKSKPLQHHQQRRQQVLQLLSKRKIIQVTSRACIIAIIKVGAILIDCSSPSCFKLNNAITKIRHAIDNDASV
jgi:hypothetical protein